MSWAPEKERQVAGACTVCGQQNPPGSSWCTRCGAGWIDHDQEAPTVRRSAEGPLNICPDCGQINAPVDRFCRRCGAFVVQGRTEQPTQQILIEPRKRPTDNERTAVVIAAVLVVAAAVIALGGGSTTRVAGAHRPAPPAQAAPPTNLAVATHRASPTHRTLPAQRTSATTKPAVKRPRSIVWPLTIPTRSPLAAVAAYWQSVSTHEYPTAYDQLLPGSLRMTEEQFASYEQTIKVRSARFEGRLAAQHARRAAVAVVSLVTRDGLYGCQTWSGSYALTRTVTGWKIARALITPSPCTARPTVRQST